MDNEFKEYIERLKQSTDIGARFFIHFLTKNDLLSKFKTNLNPLKTGVPLTITNALLYAFTFIATPEGEDFWHEINRKWLREANIFFVQVMNYNSINNHYWRKRLASLNYFD